MRIRTVKPSFFKDERLAELSIYARLLFVGLWCLADREGRLEDRPKRIRAEVFPYDELDAEPLLVALHDRGHIRRYAVGGRRFIAIPSFLKHQRISGSEAKYASTIPPPAAGSTEEAPGNDEGSSEEEPGTTGKEYIEIERREGEKEHSLPDVESVEKSEADSDRHQSRKAILLRALDAQLLSTEETAVKQWETLCRKAGITDYDEACAFVTFAVTLARRKGVAVSYARHVLDLAPAWRQWARDRHWRGAAAEPA